MKQKLVKNQIMVLEPLLLFEKKGRAFLQLCVCLFTYAGMDCLVLILCIKVAAPFPFMCLGGYIPCVNSVGSTVP